VPPLPEGPTLPSESIVNAPALYCTVAAVNAIPVSRTATVISEPAAGWTSQAVSMLMAGRFHCVE
jgi:hypothetical protein